jgi:hypothetical protein
MKVHIAQDDLGSVVKVWIYNDVPEGRIFMWPIGYTDPSHKSVSWYQEIVAHGQAVPDTIRPALEFTRTIWDSFKEALLADTHMRIDALDIVAKTLEREQNRVDALIHALIKDMGQQSLYIEATGGPVGGD